MPTPAKTNLGLSIQERLANEVVKTLKSGKRRTHKEMMVDAGYSTGTAVGGVKGAFSGKAFLSALEKRGVNPTLISNTIHDALGATLTATYRGTIIQSDSPDHKTRLQAVDRLADLTGLKKTIVEKTQVNVSLDASDIRDMLGFG